MLNTMNSKLFWSCSANFQNCFLVCSCASSNGGLCSIYSGSSILILSPWIDPLENKSSHQISMRNFDSNKLSDYPSDFFFNASKISYIQKVLKTISLPLRSANALFWALCFFHAYFSRSCITVKFSNFLCLLLVIIIYIHRDHVISYSISKTSCNLKKCKTISSIHPLQSIFGFSIFPSSFLIYSSSYIISGFGILSEIIFYGL